MYVTFKLNDNEAPLTIMVKDSDGNDLGKTVTLQPGGGHTVVVLREHDEHLTYEDAIDA